ncbi:MAG: chloride channel protein [Bacteroidota bacterium]|nr:chloride channel protein [Bacteroidota bacterium]
MKIGKFLGKFLIWRVKHINHRQFILLLSFIVGILSGLAAVVLKNSIYYTNYFLLNGFSITQDNYLFLLYPLFGILLTVLFVNILIKDNIGHGVARILYSISKNKSNLKSHNSFSSIIASTLTIGFGGSVGSEAPIVLTGASIGSNLAKLLRLDYRARTLLIGCGSAGAIAGIFNAPLAGIIFTLEVLMLDLTLSSIVPLLISSVTASTLAYFFMGKGFLLKADLHIFELHQIPYYIVLGIITGLVSIYFTRGNFYVESLFKKINSTPKKLMLGGSVLAILIFFFPSLYGEGYEALQTILEGHASHLVNNNPFSFSLNNTWIFIGYLLLILFFKVIAMSVTTGAGGVGGIFAPTLFMGGITGLLVSRIFNIFSNQAVSESDFALVGMGGLMAGVMHAPLTGIFLIAEITGGYSLFIPLMITATISYLTIIYFEPYSIYTKRLAQRGELLTHDTDKSVLTLMQLDRIIETDLKTVSPEATLGELVKVVSQSNRNIFPVIDSENTLIGIILLDHIRDIMFDRSLYDNTCVTSLMIMPPTYVSSTDSMDCVMKKFSETKVWNLPVINNGKYVGFISKSKIFNSYRDILTKYSTE